MATMIWRLHKLFIRRGIGEILFGGEKRKMVIARGTIGREIGESKELSGGSAFPKK
jgi:hypothetical protein